jgi:hypothetical protein
MNKPLFAACIAAFTLAASQPASATVVQTFGAGSAVLYASQSADFELNTTLANNYVENGLLLSYVGSDNNNNCGYAGVDCYDTPQELSPAFSGNYLATAGANAYISVRKADGGNLYGIEWAAGSGYLTLNGFWRTFNDGLVTGAGNFSQADGAVVGLTDDFGFDEVRYYAFSAPDKQSGYSAAAIDAVRASDVPEPASALLIGAGLLGLAGLRRKR